MIQKLKLHPFVYLFLGASVLLYLTGCSPYDRRPVSMVYHNTTSHYNAYYLARLRMKELEDGLYMSYKDNFNRILDIYPRIDSNFSKANKDKIDKIIKNASLPIQWHKYSSWVDDTYLIIGKCRYYDVDWENAVTTFRFINSKYDDKDVKHDALIWMMRVYMEQKEWDQARKWGDILEEEYLNPSNVGKLSLANGHYYLKQGDYKNAFEKLKIGSGYIKPKDYRAKIYYILGQLGQKLENDKEAYAYYNKCLKSRPPYELGFYARLNMYQMKELKNDKDAEKILRFYNKMLVDLKNTEYKDRIYYEMGSFELKRERLPEAIDYFKLSAKNAKTSTFTKSFAYLRMAEIYYDRQQQFEKSSVYYDSTVQILEKDLPEYPKAARRQRVLKEFMEQLTIVRREDSLQKLAKMDSVSLGKLVDKWIEDEEKKRIENEKLEKKLAREAEMNEAALASAAALGVAPVADGITNQDNRWYFYNPASVDLGKQDFLRKWGNRPLEDNWRRSNKEKEEELPADGSTLADNNVIKDTTDKPLNVSEQRKKYYENIPLSKVQMDTSMVRLKRAMFRLARIYDFNLEEYKNARQTYDRFIKEFPEEEKRPEAMYAAYIICKIKVPDEACMNKYKNMLLDEYPNSLYAKLIKNPNYLKENRLLGEKIKYLYRNAFEMYESEDYLSSQNAVASVMSEYPANEYEDRFMLLKAMIIGRTQSMKNYQDSLSAFITRYNKSSNLVPYAKNLLDKANKLAKDAPAEEKVVYDLDLNYPHYFCVVVDNVSLKDSLSDVFEPYNEAFFTDNNLKITSTTLADTSQMLNISSFVNKIQAMNYYEKQKGKSSPLNHFPQRTFTYFVISEKNFKILSEAKTYKSYLQFFKKNY